MTMFTGSLPLTSNQESFTYIDSVVDDATGNPVDLTGAVIVFEFRDPQYRQTALSATTGNGKVTIIDIGVYQVAFTRSDMQGLHPGVYDVGCVITINGATAQFIIGTMQVLDGIVSQ